VPLQTGLVEEALLGRREAVRALIDGLTPVIQARVARVLLRRRVGPQKGRSVQQEVADLSQEVFVSLFESEGRALRSWRADGGLSLEGFVGLVAERQVISILRSGKRSPWKDEPVDAESMDGIAEQRAGPEREIASREQLRQLLDRVRETLSPRGLELFERLIVLEEPVERVCADTKMSRDAVYAWRSRLSKTVKQLASEMEKDDSTSDPAGSPRMAERNGMP
jgi:DNA-directed RNA polymerase specialized sigma24 family protein